MSLILRPKSECKYDLISLGEIMLRLDPGEGRIRTTREFKAWEGGGEYNVARGLRRCFGLTTAVATAFAWAGAQNGPTILGFPALLFIVSIGFLIHWVIFIPSYFMRTEKFYDITGTIAYLAMISTSVYVVTSTASTLALRSKVVIVMVVVWAMRLGLFLFIRVLKAGEDSRFEDAKRSASGI